MREITVRFCSFQDVQEFVSLATEHAFPIIVGNDTYQVNGTSFMGMFTLDCSKPMRVQVDCTEEEFAGFCRKAERFLAK